jgi:hypothetical protein
VRWLAASLLTGALIAAPTGVAAAVTPPPPNAHTVTAAKGSQGFTCRDRVAKILHRAGFRGHSHRIAWAVVMRESKGQNLDERSPWYTGALGIFQVQTSAHSRKPWWSRAAMLDPDRQARIVYLHMTNRGKYWRPWGLTPNGRGVDARDFGRWSSWQVTNWIWIPYERFYRAYPC